MTFEGGVYDENSNFVDILSRQLVNTVCFTKAFEKCFEINPNIDCVVEINSNNTLNRVIRDNLKANRRSEVDYLGYSN